MESELLNPIGHIFLANFLLLFGAHSYVSPTILIVTGNASTLSDLDHIPWLRLAIKTRRFGTEARTRWHELPGLLLSMAISIVITYFSASLGRSLLIGFVSHYFLDLLTRPTRPFYPISEKVVFLELAPRSLRKLIVYDTVLTEVMGVVWIWSLHGQGFLCF